MKSEKMNILKDQIQDVMKSFGFFMKKIDGTVLATQTGTIRTNCLDCLDRTNVIQVCK